MIRSLVAASVPSHNGVMARTAASQPWLIAAGLLSAAASLLHVGCVFGGPDWYRFFGAGEDFARLAERGHWLPPVMTMGIAVILAIWAAYAFSGAGRLPRLPLLRTGLVLITGVYLLRGLIWIPSLTASNLPATVFDISSSLIVLSYGLVHLVGVWKAWPQLKPRAA